MEVLAVFFCRALGMTALLPFGPSVSGTLKKMLIAAGLTLFFGLSLPVNSSISPAMAAAEFAIGLTIALPAVLLLEAAEMIGELFDTSRGQSIAKLYDPMSVSGSSQMGKFSKNYLWVLLLFSGILERLLIGFQKSLIIIPFGEFREVSLVDFGNNIIIFTTDLLCSMTIVFFPIAVLFLLLNLAVGFVSKVLPGIAVYSETFQLKTYLGFLALSLAVELDLGGILINIAAPVLEILPV